MKLKNLNTILIFILVVSVQTKSLAQATNAELPPPTIIDTQTINEIDSILKQNANTNNDADTSKEVLNRPITTKEIKKLNVSDYSKIIANANYDDYSIVQKNYMPKSNRWQLKSGLTTLTNDVFYNSLGINLGAIFNFSESWGVGISGSLLSTNLNNQAQNIRDIQGVLIESLVTMKNSFNASAYFSPIYGKWSLLNTKIYPFEIYFSGGLAQVTNQSNAVSTATSTSIGQLISLTRSSAIDINLQWLLYNAKDINNQDQTNNSLLLSVSYSIFWPKPDYR